ncbi:MAG TPA: 2TM domain-containing protein [Caulobacteraceae bacterium]|nr:2TM domain-containing protein [Caulobacteraceae bacterium]
MSDFANESELRRLAERRVDAKAGFWIHAAIYVVVNAGMALGNLSVTPSSPWFLWSAGCWGIALIAQGVMVYAPTRELRRRAVEAELARLRQAARD